MRITNSIVCSGLVASKPSTTCADEKSNVDFECRTFLNIEVFPRVLPCPHPTPTAVRLLPARRTPLTPLTSRILLRRHCKCAADRERQSTFCECSCLPGAPLPDISPLRVEGNPCLSPSGIRLSTSAGTKALSHIRGLLESGGVTRDGGESEGSDAPKNLDALRKQLRQKDMLRSGVSEYHSLISFGHRAASHGMFFAFHTRSLWRFSSLEVEIFCRK